MLAQALGFCGFPTRGIGGAVQMGLALLVGLASGFGVVAPSYSQTSDLPPPPTTLPTTMRSPIPGTSEPTPTVLMPDASAISAPLGNLSTSFTSAVVSGFRVLIPSDNPTLLAQARQIEPQAFIHTINDVRFIQLGAYRTEAAARQRVDELAQQGLETQIQAFGGEFPTGTSPFNPRSNPYNSQVNRQPIDRGYYVVIPVTVPEVNGLRRQLLNLGVPSGNLVLRDRPYGLHFAIGIYREVGAAKTMNQYLLEQGVRNTRVYLQR
ncbi:MAG: SPOR domain-containing protein [Synechococcales bacterium]|nr:SPOR domain-containing protein [Synechococcales bacterium]